MEANIHSYTYSCVLINHFILEHVSAPFLIQWNNHFAIVANLNDHVCDGWHTSVCVCVCVCGGVELLLYLEYISVYVE